MVRKYQYALHTGTKYRYYFMELLWESRMYAREDIDCDVKLTSQGGSQSKPCESHGDAAKEQSDRPGLLPTRGHFLCLAGVHSLSTVTLPHGNPLCCPVCIPFSGSLPLFIPLHGTHQAPQNAAPLPVGGPGGEFQKAAGMYLSLTGTPHASNPAGVLKARSPDLSSPASDNDHKAPRGPGLAEKGICSLTPDPRDVSHR